MATRAAALSREDRWHQPDHPDDQRSKFQRDRDRILYSSAFRRLAGVTQVVHAGEGHSYHNRLTHSLKVAQVGRRIAEHLLKHESPELILQVGGIDPDVVETACLAHDLGHPPFGHVAEQELDERLKKNNLMDGFEGNPQSFRIVTKVAIRHPGHPGLNLTRASLNAILKYPWERGAKGTDESEKWGFYKGEKQDFVFARGLNTTHDKFKSAEASIMDWADDVAYSVHDVDDFYRAGLIPLDQLLAGTEERTRFINYVFEKWKKKDPTPEQAFYQFATVFFNLFKPWKHFGLFQPFIGSSNQRLGLGAVVSFLTKRYVAGLENGPKALTLSTAKNQPRIVIEPELRKEVNLLKELMSFYVFDNPALVAQQYGQREVVGELFRILLAASPKGDAHHGIIPQPFRGILDDLSPSDDPERTRVVADIIASMTEQQALLFYKRLKGMAPGSVRDLIVG